MKSTIILSAFFLLNLSFIYAQSEDETIKLIRQQFKTINDEIKSYTSVSYEVPLADPTIGHTLITYYKGNSLMKIEEILFGDMTENSSHFYFWDDQLFFVFSTNTFHSYNDGNIEDFVTENRFYFSNNKLIRWMDSDKKQKDKNTKDFKDNESLWTEKAQTYLLEYAK